MQHDPNAAPRRKKKNNHDLHETEHPVVHDESNWLVSYADMMTLLFGFFVLMYSFSKIDHDKFDVVRKDMAKYFGGEVVDNPGAAEGIKPLEKDLTAGLKAAFEQTSDYNTKLDGDTLILTINSDVLFPPGSAVPGDKAVQAIRKVYEAVKGRPLELIEVEGHTDSDPIATSIYPSNWELSTSRAASIVRLFESLDVPANQLKAAGYAASRPTAANEKLTPVQKKQQDRRVVINLKLDPNGANIQKQLQEQGLDIKKPGAPGVGKGQSAAEQSLQEKYEAVQMKMKQAADRLAEAKARERKVKELEALNKKTADLEKKIEEMQKKTQETLDKAQQGPQVQ